MAAKKTTPTPDLVAQAKAAQDAAHVEATDDVATTAAAQAKLATSQKASDEPDVGLSAVMLDAARKAENAKRNDEAEAAADLGNGYFIRADAIEYRGVVKPYTGRRTFDVGGQPVHDPALVKRAPEEKPKA